MQPMRLGGDRYLLAVVIHALYWVALQYGHDRSRHTGFVVAILQRNVVLYEVCHEQDRV